VTLLWLVGCGPATERRPRPDAVLAPIVDHAPPAWPDAGAPLWRLAPVVHPRARAARVMLDPGHGAPGNEGNTGVRCQKEAAEMLRIAGHVQARLGGDDGLELRTTRPAGQVVDYGTRIARADAWADVLVSFHSDARAGLLWTTDPLSGCARSEGAHGFAVLWSDEGTPALVQDRQRLAIALAEALVQAGFPAYGGEDYVDLYAGDPLSPGVFVDRHTPDQRIRMLRRPEIPSVIVETHNAPDPGEVDRWQEPGTLDVFADALRVGLDRYFAQR
jgi:N-acetylmuramoyl-L-alanine amidase